MPKGTKIGHVGIDIRQEPATRASPVMRGASDDRRDVAPRINEKTYAMARV